MMAMIWAQQIMLGKKTYAQVPRLLKEKAEDLMTLLSALPPGQVKNLMKDETFAAILQKYGLGSAKEKQE